ncbi:LOW QUALITY PROTEIN: integrin alpha-E [Trichosurus vulpecula]|uniref:LOW QUALITY PROTEIN: integrin alpha-E n=1 Tax=Trichosurus vulpecula TaxID=9337 RepID=UPI00186B0699|nr:LOW QUALITY PROTEIN: integrin alpha-E [Trichosurus vulpecula]
MRARGSVGASGSRALGKKEPPSPDRARRGTVFHGLGLWAPAPLKVARDVAAGGHQAIFSHSEEQEARPPVLGRQVSACAREPPGSWPTVLGPAVPKSRGLCAPVPTPFLTGLLVPGRPEPSFVPIGPSDSRGSWGTCKGGQKGLCVCPACHGTGADRRGPALEEPGGDLDSGAAMIAVLSPITAPPHSRRRRQPTPAAPWGLKPPRFSFGSQLGSAARTRGWGRGGGRDLTKWLPSAMGQQGAFLQIPHPSDLPGPAEILARPGTSLQGLEWIICLAPGATPPRDAPLHTLGTPPYALLKLCCLYLIPTGQMRLYEARAWQTGHFLRPGSQASLHAAHASGHFTLFRKGVFLIPASCLQVEAWPTSSLPPLETPLTAGARLWGCECVLVGVYLSCPGEAEGCHTCCWGACTTSPCSTFRSTPNMRLLQAVLCLIGNMYAFFSCKANTSATPPAHNPSWGVPTAGAPGEGEGQLVGRLRKDRQTKALGGGGLSANCPSPPILGQLRPLHPGAPTHTGKGGLQLKLPSPKAGHQEIQQKSARFTDRCSSWHSRGLLVTGPWRAQGAAHFHNCSLLQDDQIHCQPLKYAPTPQGSYPQVSMARGPDGTLVACAQVKRRRPRSLAQELNGACSLLGADLGLESCFGFSSIENLPVQETWGGNPGGSCLSLEPAASGPHQDRPNANRNNHNSNPSIKENQALEKEEDGEAGTEIAIVLDGSGSIDPSDFQRAKDFIHNMMQTFYKKCFECRFAVVQYGEVIQTEFDLEYSRDVDASLQRVMNIIQVGKVTKTASAIQHVLDSVFTSSRGSREKAYKVIVVLTDGDIFQDPLNLSTVIHSPQMKGIERFAIGVGAAFNNTKANQELHLIASDPDETHAFKVTDYSALDGLLSSLEQRIISVEGTIGEALQYELAQIGFSVHVLGKQQVLLGAVGAFDWSGGVMLYNTDSHQFHFLNESMKEPRTAQYSYLGYSLTSVKARSGTSYLAGAPQHGQRGKVLSFRRDAPALGFLPVLEGEQMGSYFGSELCTLDVNMDGVTDHLLVGAPFYHVRGEEGRVYVYRLEGQPDSFVLSLTLSGRPQFVFARFGFAIAAAGDLNQDRLGDVVIGAPLEGYPVGADTSFGSIYIYNGHPDGIAGSPSQWVRAANLAPGLRYFGVSVDGGVDISGDGLDDVAVGSLGRAAVLCSRPVVRPQAAMIFSPSMVRPGHYQNISTRLCFEMTPDSPWARKGAKGLPLNVTIELDVKKHWKRVLFEDRSSRSQQEWLGPGCVDFLLIPAEGEACDNDCFSNITIKVSYQLSNLEGHWEHPQPILDQLSKPTAHFELPYEKNCQNKSVCVAELKLKTHLSPKKVVVGVTREVTMNIHLANTGEDSYMTRMILMHPPNLQLKRIQKPYAPPIECMDPTPAIICKIGHSVFKKSYVNLSITWQLDEKKFPNETAEITINVTNSNGQPPVEERQELQVKYHLAVALHKTPSPPRAHWCHLIHRPLVTYMTPSRGLSEHKEFQFDIHGENLFGAEFVLEVCVPAKVQGHDIIKLKNVTTAQAGSKCSREPGCKARCPEEPAEAADLQWLRLRCALSSAPSKVGLGVELSPQLPEALSKLCIPAEISFHEGVYESLGPGSLRSSITIILLKAPRLLTLPIILGSSAGGVLLLVGIIAMLWKCGFFKRKYQGAASGNTRKSQELENLPQAEN